MKRTDLEDPKLHDAILNAAAIVTKIQECKHGLDSAVTAESVTAEVAKGPADLGPATVPDAAGTE